MTKLHGARVLIVEDDAIIAMMVEDMLSELGCEIVATAARLEAAVEKARTLDLDLAMLDVNLDGRETFPVADVLTERGVPFVFSTGYGAHVTSGRYEGAPTLQKPYETHALERAIVRALSQGEAGQQAARP
jgi:DNA-binding response OmpR family regulator